MKTKLIQLLSFCIENYLSFDFSENVCVTVYEWDREKQCFIFHKRIWHTDEQTIENLLNESKIYVEERREIELSKAKKNLN